MPLDPHDPVTHITRAIIGSGIDVHSVVGPGCFETAYQPCLEYELHRRGVKFRRQVPIPLIYRGVRLECGFRADLIVEDKVLVEVKAVERLANVHYAQMITYLKLTGLPVGLLLNFNVTSLRHGIRRIANRFLPDQRVGDLADLIDDVERVHRDRPDAGREGPSPFDLPDIRVK